MDVKISIKGATAEQVAQIFANIQALDAGSEMVVAGKTKDMNLTPRKGKGPVKTENAAPAIEDDAELAAQDEQENETPVTPAKESKKRGSRATKEQVEEANKNKPAERTPRRGSDDEEGEQEEEERRAPVGAGGLVEKMMELGEEFIGLYETRKGGENALTKRLKTFGVTQLSEVAPADRGAVILMLKKEIETPA